jgi:dienelactone hydrolase
MLIDRRCFLSVAAVSLAAKERNLRPKNLAEWKLRRREILEAMQAVMGPLPPKSSVPLDVRFEEETVFERYVRRKLTYVSEAGDRVPAYLLVPHGEGRRAAMLCLHQTTRIGKGEPAGLGPKQNLHYAKELAELGFVTLAPDYPNFGDYQIDVYAMGYASATMKGIVNHRRAIDLLASLPQAAASRTGVIGHSLGGHNSLFLAAFDGRVKAVVTSCGFTSFWKYYGGDLTGWSHKGYMPRIAEVYKKDPALMPFDFPEVLAAIAPRPIFVNAPTGDDNFAVGGVADCVRAARYVYQQIYGQPEALRAVYPEAGHDFPTAVRQEAYRFLSKWLA